MRNFGNGSALIHLSYVETEVPCRFKANLDSKPLTVKNDSEASKHRIYCQAVGRFAVNILLRKLQHII